MKCWNGTKNQKGKRVFFTNELTVFEIGKEYAHTDTNGTCYFRVLEELGTYNYLCQFVETGETFELLNDSWK